VKDYEQPPPREEIHKEGKGGMQNRKEELEKSNPKVILRIELIEQLLKESSIFNNYFNDHVKFTSVPKGKLPPKFNVSNIKFHGTENLHHHMKNFVSVRTLKGTDKDILYFRFPWTFDKDVIIWYTTLNPRKAVNYDKNFYIAIHMILTTQSH